MKASIDVQSRQEGDAIKRALEDPQTRAFTVVMGMLADLPSDRARVRVLNWAADYLQEQRANGDGVLRLHLGENGTTGE